MKLFHLTLGPIATNTFIAADDAKNAVVVDPAAEAQQIIKALEDNGLTLRAILLTHAHYDHIGAVAPLCEKYSGIKVFLHADDLELAENYKAGNLPEFIDKQNYKNLKITDFVKDGDEIAIGDMTFKVVHTPGHTRGGCCYLAGDIMFSGDTLFRREVGRTDLKGGDYPTLLASLRKLCALEGDFTVLPGHEGFSTLNEERRENYYIGQAMK